MDLEARMAVDKGEAYGNPGRIWSQHLYPGGIYFGFGPRLSLIPRIIMEVPKARIGM